MQPITANAAVGAKVARLREQNGLSQAQLAEALARRLGKERMDPTSVTRLEKGTRPTTVDELYALGQIFNMPVEEFLSDTSPMSDLIASVSAELKRVRALKDQGKKILDEATQREGQLEMVEQALKPLKPRDRELSRNEEYPVLKAVVSFLTGDDSYGPPLDVNPISLLIDLGYSDRQAQQFALFGLWNEDDKPEDRYPMHDKAERYRKRVERMEAQRASARAKNERREPEDKQKERHDG